MQFSTTFKNMCKEILFLKVEYHQRVVNAESLLS